MQKLGYEHGLSKQHNCSKWWTADAGSDSIIATSKFITENHILIKK
jgi:hypothetical protein